MSNQTNNTAPRFEAVGPFTVGALGADPSTYRDAGYGLRDYGANDEHRMFGGSVLVENGMREQVARFLADTLNAQASRDALLAEAAAMLRALEPDLAWGTTGRYKGAGSDHIRALLAKLKGAQ